MSQPKQFYYCFGCQISGNAISFLMQYDRLEFIDALKTLAAEAGLELPQTHSATHIHLQPHYDLLLKATRFYEQQLRQHQPAIDYLKSRGLTGEIAKAFHIGYAPNEWDKLIHHLDNDPKKPATMADAGLAIKNSKGNFYDRFRHRIIFPIRDLRGRVIGFGARTLGDELPKYLNSPETPIFHKGQELYGLYEARKAHRQLTQILIVEGYMDVIALAQHGFPFAVATLGTAMSQQQLHTLFRYSSKLIFCFDGDEAGRKAALRALEITLPMMHDGLTVLFLFLPEGEDPDTFVRRSPTLFQQRLQQALPLSEFFFQQLNKQVTGNSVDDKAKMAQLAGKLIATMPEGVFKALLLEQLAARLTLNPMRLAEWLNEPATPMTITPPKTSPYLVKRSPIPLAIALLLQHPSLIHVITDIENLASCQIGGVPTLYKLLQLLKQQPEITTGALLERWRDNKQFHTLAELAAWDHLIPSEGLENELKDALVRIQEQIRSHTIEQLVDKANQNTLSENERIILTQLLEKKVGQT